MRAHSEQFNPDPNGPVQDSNQRIEHLTGLANVFEKHGREILQKTREQDPQKFWLFISGVMRCDEALTLAGNLSDDELDAVVHRIVAGLRERIPDLGK